jgi:polyketide biosynthesis acyl carrier protein
MTRDDVLNIVKKYIVDAVDDIDPATLDANRSMKDYGVNSLDMVEVVSRSMRELKVKVPRAELNKLQNIDGLVDLLYKAVQEKVN